MMKKYLSYLPPIFSEIAEFRAIGGTVDHFISEAWRELSEALDGIFIRHADGVWLSRYEDFFGIKPKDGESAEERRFRLLTVTKGELPYTKKSLLSRLSMICGDGNFKVTENASDCSLSVTLGLEAAESYAQAEEMLRRIVPANLLLTVTQQYKTYGEVEACGFSNEAISELTHDQIRRGEWL